MNLQKIPFDEAKETIKTALKPLGDEYIEILNHGLENNWIDVYPKDGKKNGAYSWGDYDSDPFILLNYTDDLDSLFTTAHELDTPCIPISQEKIMIEFTQNIVYS